MTKEARKKARKRRKQRFNMGGYGVKLKDGKTHKPYDHKKTRKIEERRTDVEETQSALV